MIVSNLSLIKFDEYWDNVWLELNKKKRVLQFRIVSVKKEKVEVVAVYTFEFLLANHNDLECKVDISKEWREAIIILASMQQASS